MLSAVVAAVVIAGVAGSMLSSGSGSIGDRLADVSSNEDRTWGYYHDRTFDTGGYGAQYDDTTDQASKWRYDGPYDYSSYGAQGMAERARNSAQSDPLLAGRPAIEQSVFDEYGDGFGPAGGDPVGDPALLDSDPNFNPWAGYSNPYLNRIRTAYGPGLGRGAAPSEPGY